MDIAEIRRKAKDKAAGSINEPVLPDPPEPLPVAPVAVPAEPAGEGTAMIRTEPVRPVGASAGLDRLFAATETFQFATEEAYQTALASQDARDDSRLTQFLAFQLGPEEYALDITRISEIIKPREYTDIPRVPEFILGLISLRGVVVPVFDLRRRFKLGETQLTSAARIVVCRAGEVLVGLLVDSIKQVIKLDADRIEPPPAVLAGIDRQLVDGVGRYQGRMIILLNLASVLDIDMA